MDKEYVDKTITAYMSKIYSFSLTKTKNIDDAEELSSRIIFEIYKSLLKIENASDINKYIYRIARNIYARFVNEIVNEKNMLSSENQKIISQIKNNDESYDRLRKEIAFLSNLQREIVVLHYYQKLNQKEIAKRLDIPYGTVNWHLFEARNQIKDGFIENKKDATYPKEFIFNKIQLNGKPSPMRKSLLYFFENIAQMIAYTTFYEAKTSIEIARELSIPVAFVEDEISHLLDNGFMDKLAGNRYQSSIYIIEKNKQIDLKIEAIFTKYAKIISEKYIPLLMDNGHFPFSIIHCPFLYVPQNDLNFFLWSVITYALDNTLLYNKIDNESLKYAKKRKDGGFYNLIAIIGDKASTRVDYNLENTSMYKKAFFNDEYQMTTWLHFSHFDEREKAYYNDNNATFEKLFDFIIGKISKDKSNVDDFVRLYENGLLVSPSKKQNSEYVNMIITTLSEEEFINLLPPLTEELKQIIAKLDNEILKAIKTCLPNLNKEMWEIYKGLTKNKFLVFILEYLLNIGILKPLLKHQKKTVNMIMFKGVLPERTHL